MPYTQRQVERGRKLVASLTKSKFALGDLALEVVPADTDMNGLDYRTSPERTELERFAEAIGLEFDVLREYRRVALTYPQAKRRMELSYTVHRDLMSLGNPVKVLHQRRNWTATTVREYRARQGRSESARRGATGVSPGQTPFSTPKTRQERIAVAREALAGDPDVAGEVLRDKRVRQAVSRAQVRGIEQREEQRRAQPRDDLDELQAHVEAGRCIGDARRDVGRALEWLKDATLGEDSKEDLLERVAALEGATALLRSSIESGDRSFDDQLADLLGGEAR